jgi:hypothetical protein
VISVSNANARLYLEAGKDYVVAMPDSPLTVPGGLWVIGGRNVVVVGGEISNDTPIASPTSYDAAYGLYLRNQTGTVHLEGLWIHGRGIGQALVLDQGAGATVQIQRSRFETLHPVGYVHTDGIQSWRGPYVLKIDHLTIQTAGVGIQVQPRQYSQERLGTWEWHHINIVQQTGDAYALWKNSDIWWRIDQSDLYVRNLGYLAWANVDNAPTGWSRWNPGADAPITGEAWKVGLRPEGDFVPASAVGIGYAAGG